MNRLLVCGLALVTLTGFVPFDERILDHGLELEQAAARPCAGWLLEGEWGHDWPLASGFYRPRETRTGSEYAWAEGGRLELSLFLAERPQRRRLVLTGRGLDRRPVRAAINGVDLGTRELRKGWTESSWELPAEALRAGANVVVLEAPVTERGRRRLAIAVDRLRIEPDASECAAAAADERAGPDGLPVALAAGTVLTAPLLVPPQGRLRLEIGGEPGAVVDLLVVMGEERWPAATLTVPPAGAATEEILLPGCCGYDRRLVVVGRGPGVARLEGSALAGDVSGAAWRRACGVHLPQLLLVGGLVGLFVLSAWRGWRLPWRRWSPWVDLLVIVAVALLVRYLYLAEYPHTEAGLFPDASEYLKRARSLASGRRSVLGDLGWHRWQSWLRPPGYYFFLAMLFKAGITGLGVIARIQTLMWVATSAATYGLARVLFGRASALFAGLAFALSLEALTFSSVIASEALFLLLMVPALALVVRVAKRPATAPALAAGLLFGLAALVRSAPMVLVPAAALAIGLGQGFRRSLRPMAALVAGMMLFVVPWCVRNSVLAGRPMGIDNMAMPNLLASHPDERYLSPGEFDLGTEAGWERYYARIKRAGSFLDGEPILGRGLRRLAADPTSTLRSTGRGLRRFFHPFTPHFSRYIGERRVCRATLFADLMNWQLIPVLILGIGAMVVRFGDRATWPVVLWFLLILGTGTVLFPLADLPRYRFSTLPVLLAFAGWAVAELHRRLGRAFGRAR